MEQALPGRRLLALGVLLISPALHAQLSPDQQEQRDRAQREARARQAQQDAPDVRLDAPASPYRWRQTTLPVEAACHRLDAIILEGDHAEAFAFAQRYLNRYRGHCVGSEGLNLIVRRVSDLIVERGYVTTRVGVLPQASSGGTLKLALAAGTIHAVRMAGPDSVRGQSDNSDPHVANLGAGVGDWHFALPARPGDLLNLRDIEQAVEQFKRLSSQDVSIDIAPTEFAGASDLVISVARTRPWNAVMSLDDSGAPATGRRQAGLNGTFDNVLGINDVLNLGVTRSVPRLATAGTRGWNGYYSVPWGKWTASASLSDYRYQQQVDGFEQSFILCMVQGQAWGKSDCETTALPPEVTAKTFDMAVRTNQTLNTVFSRSDVVLLARGGQDLSRFGLTFSHLAFAVRSNGAPWQVIHELNRCRGNASRIYREGIADFIGPTSAKADVWVIVPSLELQRSLAPLLANDADVARRLHESSYSAVAYPFDTQFQNSNQWVLEVLGAAMSTTDATNIQRKPVQAWLKSNDYRPTVLHLTLKERIAARTYAPHANVVDHPAGERVSGNYSVVTVDSVVDFLRRKHAVLADFAITRAVDSDRADVE